MSLVSKLRAAGVMGVLWGLAWIPIALGSVAVLAARAGAWPSGAMFGRIALSAFLLGGIGGMTFAGLIALTEKTRSLGQLSPWRFATLGFVAGVVPLVGMGLVQYLQTGIPLGLLAEDLSRVMAVTSVVGAGCAAGLLFVARRAPALGRGEERRSLPTDDS